MIFTPTQIQEILAIVEFHHLFVISTNYGVDVLSEQDREVLSSFGINLKELEGIIPEYDKLYLFGILSSILQENQVKSLDYNDFRQYIEKGQYKPLSKNERYQLDIAKRQSYSHLKGLKERAKQDVENIILEGERTSREEYEDAVKEGLKSQVVDRKSVSQIVSDIGHKLGEWQHDWGRIVETEGNNIFQLGRAQEIEEKRGRDALVFKTVYPQACRHCIEKYLTNGIGSQPRLFKLSDLIKNGTNIGRKVKDWVATLGSMHPYCFGDSSTPIFTSKGWKQIKDIIVGDLVLTHKGRFRKVTQLHNRDVENENIKTFNIKVRVSDKYTVYLKQITQNHPILTSKGWIDAGKVKIGDSLLITETGCKSEYCDNHTLIYKKDSENFIAGSEYCSITCKNSYTAKLQWEGDKNRNLVSPKIKKWNEERLSKMTKEERKELTRNGREACLKKYPNNSSPFHSQETRIKANRRNAEKCTFIEMKLRYFLDKLDIKYETDFFITRNEVKSNGLNKHYFPDIYIRDLNIVLEADGINWHEDVEYDKKRDREIKELIGADVFRFSEDSIRNKGDEVYKEIERIIKNHKGEYSFREVRVEEIVEFKREFGKKGIKRLYNFSVEEDESYIANGIVVHNCRCTISDLLPGHEWNEETGKFELSKNWTRKVERKSKVIITVGDKVMEV